MNIAPGRGRQPTGNKKFMKGLFSLPICCKFQNDFIHIFNDFIHVFNPGTRAENPLGTNL